MSFPEILQWHNRVWILLARPNGLADIRGRLDRSRGVDKVKGAFKTFARGEMRRNVKISEHDRYSASFRANSNNTSFLPVDIKISRGVRFSNRYTIFFFHFEVVDFNYTFEIRHDHIALHQVIDEEISVSSRVFHGHGHWSLKLVQLDRHLNHSILYHAISLNHRRFLEGEGEEQEGKKNENYSQFRFIVKISRQKASQTLEKKSCWELRCIISFLDVRLAKLKASLPIISLRCDDRSTCQGPCTPLLDPITMYFTTVPCSD